ncbi:MAG: serine/threonine protein kinase [Myxococcales bacterium]|jgi:serine/threonine-protein kinase|nr:serine/threonine protein kinase [Myxococcales bacterium]
MGFRLGTLWGRYEIGNRIAVGGMAEVYRAWRTGPTGFRKQVALKRMRPEFSDDPGFRRMFLSEASIAARLSHPNLLQAFELVEQDGELALSMEFVQGISLRKLLSDDRRWGIRDPAQRLSAWGAAYVAWSAARALRHAWEARDEAGAPLRLIHRDISPDNLLLSTEGSVKLIDFGIARPCGADSDPGIVKGKLLYMSPEQLLGRRLDARTDLYSLGIVLYESALGLTRPLFDAETDALTRRALLERQVVPPARLDPDFPEELSHLIMKALERDPDKRFPSAAALASALEAILARQTRTGLFEAELSRLLRSRQQATRTARQSVTPRPPQAMRRAQRSLHQPLLKRTRTQLDAAHFSPATSHERGQPSTPLSPSPSTPLRAPSVRPRARRLSARAARSLERRPRQMPRRLRWQKPTRERHVVELSQIFPRLTRFSLRNAPYLLALLATLLSFWSLSKSVERQMAPGQAIALARPGPHVDEEGPDQPWLDEDMACVEMEPEEAWQDSGVEGCQEE